VQHSRTFVTTIVVLASAATGYVGSRMWPLPTFSEPVIHLATIHNTDSAEPESREDVPPRTSQVSKSAPATDPIAPRELTSQSTLPVAANLPTATQIEVQGASTSSPGSSVAVSYQAPTGQADPDGRNPRKIRARVSEKERAVGRKAASRRVSPVMRGQRTAGRAPAVVEFAPNPRPNQTLRDFMSSRPIN
jgi:hypothetical protein